MNDLKNDEIDLIALIKTIYSARRFVIKTIALFSVLGIVLALVSPVRYSASSLFMPQLSEAQPNTSLSGLASLAGVNLTAITGGQPQEIAPSLYPQIAESSPYLMELLETPVGERQITFRDYILELGGEKSIIALIKKYTTGLTRLLFSTNNTEPTPQTYNLFEISEEDRDLFEFIDEILFVTVDDQEGLVSIGVEFSDRKIAAQLAQAATELLQAKIIAFKSQSARNNLQFVQSQYDAKRKEFEQIQDSIAMFKDQNLNITSSLYQNQLTRLESQFAVTSSVFQELAGQVEQAKIQVNKDTPIFMIIEPVSVPLKRSKPQRSIMVVIWTFLGGLTAVGWTLVKAPVFQILKDLKSS